MDRGSDRGILGWASPCALVTELALRVAIFFFRVRWRERLIGMPALWIFINGGTEIECFLDEWVKMDRKEVLWHNDGYEIRMNRPTTTSTSFERIASWLGTCHRQVIHVVQPIGSSRTLNVLCLIVTNPLQYPYL